MDDQDKDLKSTPRQPLTLHKKIDIKDRAGGSGPQQAFQSSSSGRKVIVEVKKNRSATNTRSDSFSERSGLRASKPVLGGGARPTQKDSETRTSSVQQTQNRSLTDAEKNARLRALQGASKFVEEQAAEFDRSSKKAAELRQLEDESRRNKQDLTEEDQESAEVETADAPSTTDKKEGAFDIERTSPRKLGTEEESSNRTAVPKRKEERRLSKISVADVLPSSGDEGGDLYKRQRTRSMASLRRAREKERVKFLRQQTVQEKIIRDVTIPEVITVQELANRMAEKAADVIKCFMKMGSLVTIAQPIDGDTAQLIAEEMGHRVKRVSDSDVEDILLQEIVSDEILERRPPVVTVMGHVDHGKTSLLDALRTTDVVSGEAGGITQHIGAYQVTLPSKAQITFIDTPGHAAFTEMRSRGAHATDIVVLVVAADDGIKDQTVEAIHHAKAAGVPIVVAINKIDKPAANPDRVRQELMQHGIFLEDLGGDVLSVEVSALQRKNLDRLEEAILLQAEMADLRSNPYCPAVGVVIESRLEKGRGPVVTTLIQKGTLKIGDFLVAGSECGRARVLLSDHGQNVASAGPSVPVEVIGFNGLPEAGDLFYVTQEESKAREIAAYRLHKKKEKKAALFDKKKIETLFSQKDGYKELAVLIKGDVQGSLEAAVSNLNKLKTDEVSVRVLHSGVGEVNETDISLAKASRAVVLGFNVKANTHARELAQKEGIEMRFYSIIYNLLEDVKGLLEGLLSPILNEKYIGRAEIRKIFKISRLGHIAGCYVSDGVVKKIAKVKVLRKGDVVYQGSIKTLKRTTDDAKEIKQGFECGILLDGFNDIQEGDTIECFEIERIARTL